MISELDLVARPAPLAPQARRPAPAGSRGRSARSCSSRWSPSIPRGWCPPARCAGPRSPSRPGSRSRCSSAARLRAPRPITFVWVALIGVLLLATIRAVDPLSAWIGTPDRRLGFLAWLTLPALFLAGHSCTTRAATRILLRAGTTGASVLGLWAAAEVAGHAPLGLTFAAGARAARSDCPRISAPRACCSHPSPSRSRSTRARRARVEIRRRVRRGRRAVRARGVADARGVDRRRRRGRRGRGRQAFGTPGAPADRPSPPAWRSPSA